MNKLIFNSKNKEYLALISVVAYFWLYLVMYWFGVKNLIPFQMETHRAITVLLFSVISIFLAKEIINEKNSTYNVLFIVFISYVSLVVFINYIFFNQYDDNGVGVFKFNLYIVMQYVICYFIGKEFFGRKHSQRSFNFVVIGHLICLMILFAFKESGSVLIDVSDMEHGQKGIYLFSSDYLAFFGLYIVATSKQRKDSIIAIILCSAIIFSFLSRSSFFLFLFTSLLLFSLRYTILSITLACVLLAFFVSNWSYLYEHYPRMFFFLNYASDASVIGREIQKEIGYVNIYNHFILGDYGGQVRELGYVGEYIHNILSYWRQFGLLPFVLILTMVFYYPTKQLLSLRHLTMNSTRYRLLFLFFTYTILQVSFSRSFAWPFLFLFVGLISSYESSETHNDHDMGKSI